MEFNCLTHSFFLNVHLHFLCVFSAPVNDGLERADDADPPAEDGESDRGANKQEKLSKFSFTIL